ncbi:3-hydroxyacyl-ACP dehydratase FabZ [Pseudotabrizicola algicola]|uniref:3-hydroxyacyl-[acyl-carrier-protein] dehydratase FabZ n=1 Tax=Pseudotabrizicola algicola TaxID=2709381 RepID=A0A6B3RPW9_9RHOB|nr:3-hydroxyacyl-ACP dehydratase FabZ [Pseudotabrizicola algicola]NEX45102.1 3-hydroxyacyl-ACP dehydratase FabZ [Pseudotabrizicola algicola]
MTETPVDASASGAGQTADIALIQRILPHRYPFLLVDKVVDIHINKSCVGIKCVTMNEPQFTGHFPGTPIFPGVMIIEAMAQTSGILVGLSMDLVDKNANVFFMGVDGVKFRRKVVPGDVLELHVKALRGGGRVWKFEGRGMVGDELACEAEFTAMFDVPKKV